MKIKIRGGVITITLADGRFYDLPQSHFTELYNALTLVKELVNCESLESVDVDYAGGKYVYQL